MTRAARSLPARLVTGALTALLAIGAGVASASAAPVDTTSRIDDHSTDPAYAQFFDQDIAWGGIDCADYYTPEEQALYTRYYENSTCQVIQAPKDWRDPSKGSIDIAFSVRKGFDPATNTERLLFTNPGGPGGTGSDFGSILDTPTFAHINAGHAVVGVDPRGVGFSTHVNCAPLQYPEGGLGADGDSSDPTAAEIGVLQNAVTGYNSDCAASDADLLPYISTQQTARDFDLVRHLLSNPTTKTDYYGVSYGTWLGSYIKRMFPLDFDRILLDGNTDWEADSFYDVFSYQPAGFQASVDTLMVPFLARHDDAFGLGSTPAEVTASIAEARAAVGAEYERTGGQSASPDEFDGALVQGQYSTSSWGGVAQTIASVRSPLPAGGPALQSLATAEDCAPANCDNSSSTTMLAITCNDTAWPTDDASYIGRLDDATRYPLLGPGFTINSCAGWPYRDTALPQAILDRPFAALMTDNEVDPATAYEGSWRTNKEASSEVKEIVVDNGAGHGIVTGLAAAPNPCVSGPVTTYLQTGRLPAGDSSCQTVPYTTRLGQTRVSDTQIFEFGNRGTATKVPQAFIYDPTAKNPRRGYNAQLDRDVDPSKFGSASGPAAPAAVVATRQQAPQVSDEALHAHDLIVEKYETPVRGAQR